MTVACVAQRPRGSLSRVRHAHARPAGDQIRIPRLPLRDPQLAAIEGCAVEAPIDGQGLTQPAGAASKVSRPRRFAESAVAPHHGPAFDHLSGPQQHGAAVVVSAGDGIETVMHTVDEVDIGEAPAAKQRSGADSASPTPGVTRAVLGAEIGLGLDDSQDQPAPAAVAHQKTPEQIGCHALGWPAVERSG